MQRTVSDVIADFGQKMSKFKLPNNNFTTKLAGLDYVKDYVDLHINMMRVFLEAIPSIRWHQLQVGCLSKEPIGSACYIDMLIIVRHFQRFFYIVIMTS